MQTWPSEEAYRAMIAEESSRNRQIEIAQRTYCQHDRTLREACEGCGRLTQPVLSELDQLQYQRLPNEILQVVGRIEGEMFKIVWAPGHDIQVMQGDRTVTWLSGKERVHLPSQMALVIRGWLDQQRRDQ
jgi:hypothetical protein